MLVMSNLPSLCAELSSGQEPFGDYWILTLWTQNRSLELGEYNADGYFLRVADEHPFEKIPQSATINLTNIEEERRLGRYTANFEDDDFVLGQFDANTCPGVYLFLGMEN